MLNLRNFCKSVAIGGFTLLIAPVPYPLTGLLPAIAPSLRSPLEAQRMRPRTSPPPLPPPDANPQAPVAPAAVAPVSSPAPAVPQAAPSAGLPASLLDQPSTPARIEFAQDTLSIQADNSSLHEILHRLAAQYGMKIDGLGQDERVFGSFGPGTPRDVIADLLNGAPYNLLMAGDQSNGAPSHLILTPATGAPDSTAPATPQPTPPPATPQPAEVENNGNSPPHPPFAVPHSTAPPGTKSPQAFFEEMQAMHQRQLQQQQQQQQAPQ